MGRCPLAAAPRRGAAATLMLMAALPAAGTVFLFAERQQADAERIAAVIMVSTAAAFGTFSLFAALVRYHRARRRPYNVVRSPAGVVRRNSSRPIPIDMPWYNEPLLIGLSAVDLGIAATVALIALRGHVDRTAVGARGRAPGAGHGAAHGGLSRRRSARSSAEPAGG